MGWWWFIGGGRSKIFGMKKHETKMRITWDVLRQMKRAGEPIAMLTCYDFPTAGILALAGVHVLLVGDSAANTVLGLGSTREIDPEFLLTITEAVRRGAEEVFVLADMPFKAMESVELAVVMGKRFMLEARADGVKVECTGAEVEYVKAMVAAGVPVCAHLGLLPQRVTEAGGYKAQGRTAEEAERIIKDAELMVEAGAEMLLLEAVPDEVSAAVQKRVGGVPVIGCGGGPSCDGHVLVLQDVLGYNVKPARFVEVLADVPGVVMQAAFEYVQAVGSRTYPAARHLYRMKK